MTSLSSDYSGERNTDGLAWDLGFTQQTWVLRAGAPLIERINLFANMLADVASLAEKKEIPQEDMDKIERLIRLLDGDPGDQTTGRTPSPGLRQTYRMTMDIDPAYNYQDRSLIEVAIDQALRDLKKLIGKHNLTNQSIMALIDANRSSINPQGGRRQ